MFGKKKKKQPKDAPVSDEQGVGEQEAQVHTIPDIFYGGKNPVIYAQQGPNVSSPVSAGKARGVSGASNAQLTKAHPKKSKKVLLIIIVSILFVVVVAGASFYYIQQYRNAQPANDTDSTAGVVPDDVSGESSAGETETPTVVTTTTDITPTSTESVPELETPPSLQKGAIEFPRMLFRDTVDLDADGLTDLEEELFETDPGNFDSDDDGYQDGTEVVNLYNPRGVAPIRIIESGLVREYVHSRLRYRFYYPGGWEIGEVDEKADQVLISSITGDYIEIRVFAKEGGDSFEDWFGDHATGQNILDLVPFENRFKEEGKMREDGLVAYFEKNDLVYVAVYHPVSEGSIAFRHVMEMVMQSFRPDKTVVELPDQPVLPDEDGSRDDGVDEDGVSTSTPTLPSEIDESTTDTTDDTVSPDPTDAGEEF